MGNVEELLLHVHACALALADAKVWLIEGQRVVEEVPVEGRVHIGGDCKHHGKVVGVELVQETRVRREAGVMHLVLHKCVPEGRETVGAAGCMLANADDRDRLECSGTV